MDSTTTTQTVDSVTAVSLSSMSAVCDNTPSFVLSNGAPTGGVYSGSGVSSGSFSPATAGAGSHTIKYVFTNLNNCIDSSSTGIVVNAVTAVSVGSLADVCDNTPTFTLGNGSPVGGVYSGTGVVGGNFEPNGLTAGAYTIKYVYTNSNNCMDSANSNITVHATTAAALAALADVCENAPVVSLNGGTPVGGAYKGAGVSGSTFDPASPGVGSHSITYVFVNTNNCSDSANQNIKVLAKPMVSITPLGSMCDNIMDTLYLNGGMPTGGTYSGLNVIDSMFLIDSAGVGLHTISYHFTNSDNCTDSVADVLEIEGSPVFDLGNDTTICGKATLELSTGLMGMHTIWSTGDTLDTITVKSTGNYSVVVTDTLTMNMCQNTDTIRVTYEAECVGIAEALKGIATVKYYPNPSNGAFMAEIAGLEGEEAVLYIMDVHGREVSKKELGIMQYNHKVRISVEDARTGIYFLNLVTEKGVISHRINIIR
jgi:hypothetical protein